MTAVAIAVFKALTVLPPPPVLKTNVPPVPESLMVTVELAANAVAQVSKAMLASR